MKARQVALGGVLGALAVSVLLLGGVIPVAVYVAPMLASMVLAFLLTRLPTGLCRVWYVGVSVLALLLVPDKETAFVFVFLGPYPLLRRHLQPLPRLLRLGGKLLYFNLAVGAMYALLFWVLRLDSLVQEAGELTLWLLLLLLGLGNVTFLLFDVLLGRGEAILRARRPKP